MYFGYICMQMFCPMNEALQEYSGRPEIEIPPPEAEHAPSPEVQKRPPIDGPLVPLQSGPGLQKVPPGQLEREGGGPVKRG